MRKRKRGRKEGKGEGGRRKTGKEKGERWEKSLCLEDRLWVVTL